MWRSQSHAALNALLLYVVLPVLTFFLICFCYIYAPLNCPPATNKDLLNKTELKPTMSKLAGMRICGVCTCRCDDCVSLTHTMLAQSRRRKDKQGVRWRTPGSPTIQRTTNSPASTPQTADGVPIAISENSRRSQSEHPSASEPFTRPSKPETHLHLFICLFAWQICVILQIMFSSLCRNWFKRYILFTCESICCQQLILIQKVFWSNIYWSDVAFF